MDMRGYQQYKEQSVNSMTSGELLVRLYDELVKRALMASIALDKGDFPTFEAAIDRCTDIINYLDDTLNPEYSISHDLSRLYEYFTYQLGRIRIGRNKKVLAELRPMLAELRDAFHMAEKNSSTQGKSGAV